MEYILKNMMEPLVIEKVEQTINSFDCCKCEICKLDIISYALNQLPPKYVATHIGGLYAKLATVSYQHEADVLSAINKAVKIVNQNPRHGLLA